MRVLGWIKVARRLAPTIWMRTGRIQARLSRKSARPAVEALERIDLLSRAGLGFPAIRPAAVPVQTATLNPATIEVKGISKLSSTQTSSAQSAVVPDTLTNFNLPFAPSLQLFDASLGELVSVKVTAKATLTSQIISQNTSTTSGADITGFTNGSFNIDGLPTTVSGNLNATTATVSVPVFPGGNPDFTGPTTVTFPPLVATDTRSITYSSPSDLAFFTQSTGRTTLTPTLQATAQSGATAPNGNLQTDVRTFGSGEISVIYEYEPNCPNVVRLVRFGIHHQPTQLEVTFDGPVNEADAENVDNYRILLPNRHGRYSGPGVTYSTIESAEYNPATNSVLLQTTRRLNVHHQFQLEINYPCYDGNPLLIQFGGKRS
ncbi:MAG: choice-of-anchor E domain-containing protein, partial [Isosphaeraceae bacterium]